ncbi:hypothetical protein MG293_003376 [Ovis ammon polii]|uniref:Uncharacterized protein n=1 Tax=Ovis ammon polii TaxID=230172 RepID=A0AAD4YHC3_OVIAM|nr:hypothetical protein MG293_003376 [Ovis ammon polii]KAI4577012.1 hypothetical protein MJT46_002847 [Ovis ammon polii x Ovis aries]
MSRPPDVRMCRVTPVCSWKTVQSQKCCDFVLRKFTEFFDLTGTDADLGLRQQLSSWDTAQAHNQVTLDQCPIFGIRKILSTTLGWCGELKVYDLLITEPGIQPCQGTNPVSSSPTWDPGTGQGQGGQFWGPLDADLASAQSHHLLIESEVKTFSVVSMKH